MNIFFPYNWIKEYIPNLRVSPKELAEKLSFHSHSVEKIEMREGEPVLEIEMTPNRVDCFGVWGMAREIAAIFKKKMVIKEKRENLKTPKQRLDLKIINTEPRLCRRLLGVVMDNIKVGGSSEWLKKRLRQIGIKPINNIVDITNFVMRETGQPLHSFDYQDIKGKEMKIRLSKRGEKLKLLDGKTYLFKRPVLVIQDKERLIDLLGVMGGSNSGVTEKTQTIFLQVPNLEPRIIRQTWRNLNLHTDAALLFEKGLDPRGCDIALVRAVALIKKIAGGRIKSRVIDIYPQKVKGKTIAFNLESIPRILGMEIGQREVKRILESLGFKIIQEGRIFKIQVPYWRNNDISIEEDLVEEVGRIYGYHKIVTYPLKGILPPVNQRLDLQIKLEERTKDFLKDLGFSEVYTYSLTSKKNALCGARRAVRVSNPLSREFEYMRPLLVPSLLEIVHKNQKKIPKIQIFELSKVYLLQKERLIQEKIHLALVILGALGKSNIQETNFYYLKGVLERIFNELGISKVRYERGREDRLFANSRWAEIEIRDDLPIGKIGVIKKEILDKYNLKSSIYACEIDFEELVKYYNPIKKFKKIAKYPASFLDLSIIVKKDILWYDLKKEILRAGKPLLEQVEVFDVYQGRGIPLDSRSISFHLKYASKTHSLSDEEVRRVHQRVVAMLHKKGIKIRGEERGI